MARYDDSKGCRAEGCDRAHYSRGLCNPCYQAVRRMVLAGETTWEALEAAGEVEKRKLSHRNITAQALKKRRER